MTNLQESISATGCIQLPSAGPVECGFEVLQRFDGSLEVECYLADSLAGLFVAYGDLTTGMVIGRTPSGQYVKSGSRLHLVSIADASVVFTTDEVSFYAPSVQPECHRYLLTNLTFPAVNAKSLPDAVTITIPTEPPVLVALQPVADYPERVRLLRKYRQPIPTATLSFADEPSIGVADDFASEVCSALSVVQGHKINWITHEAVDGGGQVSCKRMRDCVTKRHSGSNGGRPPLLAVEDCFIRMRELQRDYTWRPVLEIWLEARTDADYIETRALKFVTAIEALRTLILRDEVQSSVLQQPDWVALKEHILPLSGKFLAEERKLSVEKVNAIVDPRRWEQLNRTSFRSQINATFKKLGVKESSRSIELFIESRNKLVHEGRFRCNSDPAAVEREPDAPKDGVREYESIAGFVDRVILQAVGLGSYPKSS